MISKSFNTIHHKINAQVEFGFRNTRMNYLYLLFCWMGAVYYSDKVSKIHRRRYAIISGASVITITTNILSYYAFNTEFDSNVVTFSFSCLFTIIYTCIAVPYTMYRYRNEIEEAFQILDKTSHLNSDLKKERFGTKLCIPIYLVQIIGNASYGVYCLIYVAINYNPEKVRTFYPYILPTCYEIIQSPTQYAIVFISQVACSTLLLFIGASMPVLMMYLVSEFYNRFEFCSSSVSQKSEEVSKSIDLGFKGDRLHVVDSFSFLALITHHYRHHATLCQGVRHLRHFTEFLFTNSLLIFFVLQVHYVSIFLSDEVTLYQKLKYAPLMLTTAVILLISCIVGEIFHDMVEMYAESVYDTPWYHFGVKERKSILAFLQLSQEELNFCALSTYPLNMNMFQRMCNSVYSYANIRRTVF